MSIGYSGKGETALVDLPLGFLSPLDSFSLTSNVLGRAGGRRDLVRAEHRDHHTASRRHVGGRRAGQASAAGQLRFQPGAVVIASA